MADAGVAPDVRDDPQRLLMAPKPAQAVSPARGGLPSGTALLLRARAGVHLRPGRSPDSQPFPVAITDPDPVPNTHADPDADPDSNTKSVPNTLAIPKPEPNRVPDAATCERGVGASQLGLHPGWPVS